MIKSIFFIVLTQFFHFNELLKLNQQYFYSVWTSHSKNAGLF